MTRLLVVGDGPRGVWALERLLTRGLGAPDRLPERIDVVGRGRVLGTGSGYALDGPDTLLVNVSSRVVDAWSGAGPRHPDPGPSLDAWREAREPGSSADHFPPRAVVGAYLAGQGETVVTGLRALGVDVRLHRREVTRLRPGWTAEGLEGRWDHVLVASGHEPTRVRPPAALPVHPVSELLARPELRPGATVLLRGAALTMIDAALTLDAHVPGVRLVAVSRTGRMMHPKTEPDLLEKLLPDAPVADARRRIAAGAAVPESLVALATGLIDDRAAVDAAVDRLAAPDPRPPAVELAHALGVARGERDPDGPWALAQAWRAAYPALVARRRAEAATGPPFGWPEYAAWAQSLERWAFGPPPVTAERVLRLMETGRLEVRAGDVATVAADLEADLVVDAVLAPPGIRDVRPDSLIGDLVAQGLLHAPPGCRGARVDAACAVLDEHGEPVPGLSLVGRATEDVVIGTDTLIRDLHPDVDAWAARLMGCPR